MADRFDLTLAAALERIELQRQELQRMGLVMLRAYGRALYPLDLLGIAALRRSFAQIEAFVYLMQNKNYICAGAILRMQIDTALRFYAAFIVPNPHDYAHQVIKGVEVRKLKAQDGENMTDAYLVKRLSVEYEWVPRVYKETSGFIHLSAKHYFSSVEYVNSDDGTVGFSIGASDPDIPESLCVEMALAFSESIEIFQRYLHGWTFTKDNPEKVAAMKRDKPSN